LIFATNDRCGVLSGEHLDARWVFAAVGADFGAELVAMDGEDDHVTCSSPTCHRSRPPAS
jgi:hypothetical protein